MLNHNRSSLQLHQATIKVKRYALIALMFLVACNRESHESSESYRSHELGEIIAFEQTIADYTRLVESFSTETEDPQEAAYNDQQRLIALRALERIVGMKNTPFEYRSGSITTLIPDSQLTDVQKHHYAIAGVALDSLANRVRIPDGVRVLVEEADGRTLVTFDKIRREPRGLGGGYTVMVGVDSKTLEVFDHPFEER